MLTRERLEVERRLRAKAKETYHDNPTKHGQKRAPKSAIMAGSCEHGFQIMHVRCSACEAEILAAMRKPKRTTRKKVKRVEHVMH